MNKNTQPVTDLYFSYRGEEPKRCYEYPLMHPDDIAEHLQAMQSYFDKIEPGAFRFSIKNESDYSVLGLVKRDEEYEGAASDYQDQDHYDSYLYNLENPHESYLVQPTRIRINYALAHETAYCMGQRLHELHSIFLKRGQIDASQSVLSLVGHKELLIELTSINDEQVQGLKNVHFYLDNRPQTKHKPVIKKQPTSAPVTDNKVPSIVKVNKPHKPSHSDDFTSVTWRGKTFTFSKGNQAQAIRVLWEHWESGGHGLSQETIGEKIGSSADKFRLKKTFRNRVDGKLNLHPAWGSLIKSQNKGVYYLDLDNNYEIDDFDEIESF